MIVDLILAQVQYTPDTHPYGRMRSFALLALIALKLLLKVLLEFVSALLDHFHRRVDFQLGKVIDRVLGPTAWTFERVRGL